MKYLKTLALAVVAAGALTAFIGAGTASATELCSTTTAAGVACPAGQKVTANVVFSLVPGTSENVQETSLPEGEGGVLNTCKNSELRGSITNSGSSTATVTGAITKLIWGSCALPTETTMTGKFEIHKIAGTSNGTVTSDGETWWIINTIFFGTCVYSISAGKSMGDLTEGNPAIFHANAVVHKVEGSELVCPTTAVWTATYTLTEPKTTVSISDS